MKTFFVLCTMYYVLYPLLSHAKVIDRVVAVVNNDVVTEYDLDQTMASRLAEVRRSPNPDLTVQAVRRQVLDELVSQRLLQQEIEKADIEVTDEDLAGAIANVLQKNQINIEILRAELAAKGISFEAYKEQLKEQIRQAKFIQQNVSSNVQVTDQDVQNYRSGQIGFADLSATAHVAAIYLPLEPDASSKNIRNRVYKGRKLADRARRGEDFAKLANDYSEGAEASLGGDLGTKSLADLPSPVAMVVRKMEAGAVSDPIVASQGIYIVKLFEKSVQSDKDPKAQDENNIRSTIYNDRVEEEINNYVLRLRKKAYIDIRE